MCLRNQEKLYDTGTFVSFYISTVSLLKVYTTHLSLKANMLSLNEFAYQIFRTHPIQISTRKQIYLECRQSSYKAHCITCIYKVFN